LNTRQRFGWIGLCSVILLTAVLAGMEDTLPRKIARNAVLLLAAVGLCALYGYLVTTQVL
jgi:hypothetical protein